MVELAPRHHKLSFNKFEISANTEDRGHVAPPFGVTDTNADSQLPAGSGNCVAWARD